jgi:hypothetical protein
MALSGNLCSPIFGVGGGASPFHTAAFQLPSNGDDPIVRTTGAIGSARSCQCPRTLQYLDAGDGGPNERQIPKRIKFQDEVGNTSIAAAPTQGETVRSPGDLNESPHVEMSVPIGTATIAAGPIVAVTTVPVTIDGFGHSSHGCPIWHKNIGKPLLTHIGLGPSVNLQDVFNSARKPAIRIAKKAGRNETKLTCSKCALATLSHTLVMPHGSDGDEKKRKDALRNALATFLVGREVQG